MINSFVKFQLRIRSLNYFLAVLSSIVPKISFLLETISLSSFQERKEKERKRKGGKGRGKNAWKEICIFTRVDPGSMQISVQFFPSPPYP